MHDPPNPSDETRSLPGGVPADPSKQPLDRQPGSQSPIPQYFGRYRIVRAIASGGMGTVYEAEQQSPKRTVALKVIRHGLTTPALLRRFELESQVLGRLQHPGIAQIYEAGFAETESGTQPFFAMEYVRGEDLREYVRRSNLGTRQRLDLIARICDAVHHAHQKGVIHRDLKPGNILVDASGQPKILDFGVARATDSDMQVTTMQTDVGQLIGTIQYMSPEQVAADPNQLDTRSDVYSLGVIAFEILTGRPPYDLKNKMIHEAARIIREEELTRLSTFNRTLRGDVETIVGKALEKEKERRYPSAAGLAEDIRRYLADDPILARPPSAIYQFRKFARRHRVFVGAVAAVFIALSGGVVMTARQYFAAEKARAEAAKRADELEEVASFQEQQLAGINVPRMGESLRKGVLVKAREAAEWAKVGEQEISRRMELLEESLASADFTDLALDTLDQHVFEGTLAAVETQFADQPLIRARLLQTLADTMRDLGLIEQASTPQEKALELRRTILGNENEDTLFSINSMGRLRSVQGKLEEAESLYREAMERARASKGEDYVGTMIALGNLASVLQRQGKLDEAEALQKGSLEHRQRELGPEHPDTLVAMNSLALLLQERGRFKEAEALNRRALELRTKVLGPDNPETLVSLNNLGYVLRRLGRNVEAEDCYRRTLEARRQVLGNDHWHTILSVNNVGSVLRDQGKLDEALQYFKEAFESSRRVLGDEHQRTALWANNYAGVLNQLGRYEEALQILREMEPAARKVWIGENDPWLGNFFVGIGEALAGLKRFPESEKTLSDAYRRVSVKGERHEMTIRAVQALSRLYEQWHAAEPDKGYDAKAAEWRAKLEAAKSPPEAAPGTDN